MFLYPANPLKAKKPPTCLRIKVYDGYDREKRRSVVRDVGSVPYPSLTPSDDLLGRLTAEQRAALSERLAEIRTQLRGAAVVDAVASIADAMSAAAQALESGAVEIDAAWASEAWGTIDRLSRAIKRAGHPHSHYRARAEKPAPKADPRQTGLELNT